MGARIIQKGGDITAQAACAAGDMYNIDFLCVGGSENQIWCGFFAAGDAGTENTARKPRCEYFA